MTRSGSSDQSNGTGLIAVITLAQLSDFPTAWSSLRTVSPQLHDKRRRFVLLNDRVDEELIAKLSGLPWTEVIAPGQNLGVARGRNVLIRQALQWGAETIVTIDDDIYVPSDYLDRLATALEKQRLDDQYPGLAIAAPVVLDYHAIAPSIHSAEEIQAVEGGDVLAFRSNITTQDLREAWSALDTEAQRRAVHHMGVQRWRNHYFSALGDSARSFRTLLRSVVDYAATSTNKMTELRRDSSSIAIAVEGAPVLSQSTRQQAE